MKRKALMKAFKSFISNNYDITMCFVIMFLACLIGGAVGSAIGNNKIIGTFIGIIVVFEIFLIPLGIITLLVIVEKIKNEWKRDYDCEFKKLNQQKDEKDK